MLSEKMQAALNTQINKEIYSAYLYLSMAAHCESISLKGFASWMTIQVQEELSHAQKFLIIFSNEEEKSAFSRSMDRRRNGTLPWPSLNMCMSMSSW